MSKRTAAALVIAAVAALVPGRGEATPLDKLSGQTITVGNLVFSNFSWPFFTGAGPSNIDVQGLLVTDPLTGRQRAGLRFTYIQSGVPKPLTVSPFSGPHEVAFDIDYTVTDTTGQLVTVTQVITSSVAGQSGLLFSTNASASLGVTEGSLADPTLTMVNSCMWFGSPCGGSATGPSATSYAIVGGADMTAAGPLYPGLATYYAQHHVDAQTSNRKGILGGTVTLTGWDVFFDE